MKHPAAVGQALSHLGAASVGIATGVPLGFVLNAKGLPIESFQWIIQNGVAGFGLVAAFLCAIAFYREKSERQADAARQQAELLGVSSERQKAIAEINSRFQSRLEQRDNAASVLIKKQTKINTILIEILRNSHVNMDKVWEIEQIDDSDSSEDIQPPIGGD